MKECSLAAEAKQEKVSQPENTKSLKCTITIVAAVIILIASCLALLFIFIGRSDSNNNCIIQRNLEKGMRIKFSGCLRKSFSHESEIDEIHNSFETKCFTVSFLIFDVIDKRLVNMIVLVEFLNITSGSQTIELPTASFDVIVNATQFMEKNLNLNVTFLNAIMDKNGTLIQAQKLVIMPDYLYNTTLELLRLFAPNLEKSLYENSNNIPGRQYQIFDLTDNKMIVESISEKGYENPDVLNEFQAEEKRVSLFRNLGDLYAVHARSAAVFPINNDTEIEIRSETEMKLISIDKQNDKIMRTLWAEFEQTNKTIVNLSDANKRIVTVSYRPIDSNDDLNKRLLKSSAYSVKKLFMNSTLFNTQLTGDISLDIDDIARIKATLYANSVPVVVIFEDTFKVSTLKASKQVEKQLFITYNKIVRIEKLIENLINSIENLFWSNAKYLIDRIVALVSLWSKSYNYDTGAIPVAFEINKTISKIENENLTNLELSNELSKILYDANIEQNSIVVKAMQNNLKKKPFDNLIVEMIDSFNNLTYSSIYSILNSENDLKNTFNGTYNETGDSNITISDIQAKLNETKILLSVLQEKVKSIPQKSYQLTNHIYTSITQRFQEIYLPYDGLLNSMNKTLQNIYNISSNSVNQSQILQTWESTLNKMIWLDDSQTANITDLLSFKSSDPAIFLIMYANSIINKFNADYINFFSNLPMPCQGYKKNVTVSKNEEFPFFYANVNVAGVNVQVQIKGTYYAIFPERFDCAINDIGIELNPQIKVSVSASTSVEINNIRYTVNANGDIFNGKVNVSAKYNPLSLKGEFSFVAWMMTCVVTLATFLQRAIMKSKKSCIKLCFLAVTTLVFSGWGNVENVYGPVNIVAENFTAYYNSSW